MNAPTIATNHAEEILADFRAGRRSLDPTLWELLEAVVHIPMDGPPVVDEAGNVVAGESLCVPADDGEMQLVLVTSYPMFAESFAAHPEFGRVFADHPFETVLRHTRPDFGFVLNPGTEFELKITAADARSFRVKVGWPEGA